MQCRDRYLDIFKILGIIWELFGNCLEILWEFFGNFLGILREFFECMVGGSECVGVDFG